MIIIHLKLDFMAHHFKADTKRIGEQRLNIPIVEIFDTNSAATSKVKNKRKGGKKGKNQTEVDIIPTDDKRIRWCPKGPPPSRPPSPGDNKRKEENVRKLLPKRSRPNFAVNTKSYTTKRKKTERPSQCVVDVDVDMFEDGEEETGTKTGTGA
ncbi:uncharacterized protein LOC116805970 isoform X2 [Drosophila grimshawi]|nr:uncharacterized protein LOC116805970 isoform X2 [Drosophila grimshawi]